MKVALFQMDIIPGNPKENRDKVKSWVENVTAKDKVDTLVLPEMWTTAYTLDELRVHAEDDKKETFHFLSQLAADHKVNLVAGSIAAIEGDSIFNRALVFNRQGECIYKYDKMHLVPMLNEHLYLTGGREKSVVFELDGVKVGLIICYDLRFPELARSLALQGAQVLFILAEWPEVRHSHWTHLQIARAIENQMYVISSNRVGTYDGVEFCGRSMITNPWGEVLVTGSQDQEETITKTVNLDEVAEVRKNVPVFDSRVPHLYRM